MPSYLHNQYALLSFKNNLAERTLSARVTSIAFVPPEDASGIFISFTSSP